MAPNTTPEHRSIAATARRYGPWLIAVVGLIVWIALERSDARATPPSPAPAASTAPPASAAPSAKPAPPHPTIARIEFTTAPPVHATVTWGNTQLGRITPQAPLVVERPRDSGPLDVVVRARGFLQVHTRAHTFADNKLQVKLTRPDQKATLLGYRAPIDAGTELPPEDVATPVPPESPQWDMTQPLPPDALQWDMTKPLPAEPAPQWDMTKPLPAQPAPPPTAP